MHNLIFNNSNQDSFLNVFQKLNTTTGVTWIKYTFITISINHYIYIIAET